MKKILFQNHLFFIIFSILLINSPFLEQYLSAQDRNERWTPDLHMKFKGVSNTAISPDGKWIAYVVREPVMEGEKSEYLSHIWLVSSDGENNVQYTFGEKSCSNPVFSPDGKYLTFTTSRSEKNQIWIMRVYGGEAEKLSSAESGIASYKWSSEGSRIAYTMPDPETEDEKEKKKEKRDVILVDKNFKYNHLYVININDGKADTTHKTRRLTSGEFHITGFDWSPQGNNLIFSHQPDPELNTGFLEMDISSVPADSGAVEPLVTRPGVDSSPLYSPDGKWIAFTSHGGKPEPIGLRDVYVVSAKGGVPKKLADTPDRNASIIEWSKESKALYISEFNRTFRHIFELPLNGDAPKQITEKNGVFGSVSCNKEKRIMAFVYEDLNLPADVYLSGINNFKPKKLTDIHKNILMPVMGKTELIKWKSTDGFEIEGLLTYPVDYKKGTSCPLILEIHGGPAGVYSQRFTGASGIYMIQYFAQNGYAVLRPNPRGSTGYGKEFRYANFKDWGYGDYNDLMTGVDKVIEMGVGHPDSLCVMGWSYGGYMTSWIVSQTDRFKAASMGAGLPNLISMVTTTDIQDYLVAHMGGEFWNDYKEYERHSAIYHIKNASIPTQIIHGQQDFRVPFTQGREFYTVLKRLGVPVEMVVYPRTPHGPREPKFLKDVSPRIMTWFEKHLNRVKSDCEDKE